LQGAQNSMRGDRRILIVDDDAALRRSLAEQLERHAEFSALLCESAAAALAVIRREPFDAVLLGVILPDMDGRRLCRLMRGAGVTAPIIMLTGGDGEADCLTRADSGATDQLAKPFRLGTLLERLRAHLGESAPADAAVLTIGPYSFDPITKLMSDKDSRKMVRLTEKETAILQFLYRADRTIGRDTLLDQVWGYNAGVRTHTLETHIYRLRRKIERDPARAEILVTEPGGYRLLR
jgi:DNA-binding response OmpR family regulator